MKSFIVTTVLLAVGVSAVAQVSELVDVDDGTATLYEFYQTDCSTNTNTGYTATVTGTILSTYCPKCEGMTSGEAASTENGIYTTYTTVYSQWCSSGTTLEPVTYTVTESCSSLGQSREASYVPQGFTVVTEMCNCAEMTMATLTTPIALASAASTAAPAGTTAPVVSGAPAASPAPAVAPAPANTPAAPAGTPAPSIPVETVTAIAAPVPAPPAAYSSAPASAVASALEQPVASPYAVPAAPSAGPVAGYVAGPVNNSTVNPSIVPAAASSTSVSVALLGLLALAGVFQYAL